MNANKAVISAVGLTKVYRDFWHRARVRAVDNVDFSVMPGEIFGLLGPNGSGKSTSIKMILGLLTPTRGRVSVFGRPADDVRTKTRIGYLPEESYLYRFLNARETLDYYGTLFQIDRRQRSKRIDELLEMVGLRSAARRPVGEYSKGMARRIGLAQALINDPDLLILDEPTSGLDPIGSKLVKDIIVRLGKVHKKTILLSSHLLSDVEEVCDRVTILYGGKVQVSGTMEEVLARRDMIQIVTERLAPATLKEIEELVHSREGRSVEVGVPRDRLEALFLRIVQEANARHIETAGSVYAGEIAGFLGKADETKDVLQSLVQVEREPVPPAVEETEPPVPTTEILSDLIPAPPEEKKEQPEKPRPQVDRDLLGELIQEKNEERKPGA